MGKTITSIVTLTVAIILTYASTASAGGYTSDPVKTDRAYIKDHYITKTIRTPNPSTQTCREVDVPIYGNTGGSISSNTYTVPIRNADGMFLDSNDNELYVIVRYAGDPTPLDDITLTFS